MTFWQRMATELQSAIETLHSGERDWQAVRETLQSECSAVRRQLESGQVALSAADARIRALEAQLADPAAGLSGTAGQVEEPITEQAEATLQHGSQPAPQGEGAQQQPAPTMQAPGMTAARTTELEAERSHLLLRVDELTAVVAQLERECEMLRRDRSTGDDVRRQKNEISRLEAKVAEIEQQHNEAVQRHSAAVAGYMVELNERSDALHTRSVAVEKIAGELATTRHALDDTLAQLDTIRRERTELEEQLRELRAVTGRTAPVESEPLSSTAVRRDPIQASPLVAHTTTVATKPGGTPRPGGLSGPFALAHVEADNRFRDPVRKALSRLEGSRYLNNLDDVSAGEAATHILLVNLLDRTEDPLAAIAAAAKNERFHEVFAYCAEGSFGLVLGPVEFFVQPLNLDTCVARLRERHGALQRLLAVSDNLELAGAIRDALSAVRCSTSVAFDSRQAIELLPMTKPDVLLVDASLPRGDGLRLISRVRSESGARGRALAVLLPPAAAVPEFRQSALRVACESPMAPSELAAAVARWLGIQVPDDTEVDTEGKMQAS